MNIHYSDQLKEADLAVILGSGIDFRSDEARILNVFDYVDVGLESPSVQGHKGTIKIMSIYEKKLLLFSGRHHLYEGKSNSQIQSIMNCLHNADVKSVLITNAAGGINDDFRVSDLMLINSIKNYQTSNDRGLLDNLLAPVITIDTRLHSRISTAIASGELSMHKGCYAAVLGPNYETKSEIELFKYQGCDAVGMSTYMEMLYALRSSMDVAGVSVITNTWSNVSEAPSHVEVLNSSGSASDRICDLISSILRR